MNAGDMDGTSGETVSAAEAISDAPDVAARSLLLTALVIGLAAVALAAYTRYVAPSRPGVTSRLGFDGYFDQSEYLKLANLLAHFHLPANAAQYKYGLGYPILAVPFVWLGAHGDPFAPVDAITFGATAALTFVLGTRLPMLRSEHARLAAGVAAAALAVVATPLLSLTAIPWNTSITVPLTLAVFVICTSARAVTYPRAVAIGGAIGWIFAARYADAVFVAVPVVALLIMRPRAERTRIVAAGGTALSIVVALVLLTHQHAFGSPFTTPYHSHLRATGANDQSLGQYHLSDIPRHFVGTFVSGLDGGRRVTADPILRQFPLLWLAPIGAIVVLRQRFRDRAMWATLIVTSVLVTAFYLSFVAGGPGDLHFGNTRYWAAWYPLWSVLVVAAVVGGLGLVTGSTYTDRSRSR